jgi:hypothetical protein
MVEFECGGKLYTLELTHSAMKRYEKAHAEPIGFALDALDPYSATRFGHIFQAGCKPALTEEQTDDLLDALGTGEAVRLIGLAAKEAFPPAVEGDSVPDPKPTALPQRRAVS